MMRDYGSAGRIGIATPQANPAVEAEFGIMLPRRCSLHVTRLQSPATDPADRLVDYLERLDRAVAAFVSFRPDVFGFACTGSTYLVGPAREAEILARISETTGITIDTAAAAIAWALELVGARRIAIVSPYPAALAHAARLHWEAAGLTIVRTAQVRIVSDDTRGIYDLNSADAAPVLASLDMSGLDAVLVSGTGLPTLKLLARWPHRLPLLSANACLAARLMARLGAEPAAQMPGIAGWRERLAEALDPAAD